MADSGDYKQLLDQLETMKEEVGNKDPGFLEAWTQLSQQSKKAGVLGSKQKELICVALSIAARCSYCIASHVKKAVDCGASRDEILEAGFVAVSMGGGPSFSYLTETIAACDEFGAR